MQQSIQVRYTTLDEDFLSNNEPLAKLRGIELPDFVVAVIKENPNLAKSRALGYQFGKWIELIKNPDFSSNLMSLTLQAAKIAKNESSDTLLHDIWEGNASTRAARLANHKAVWFDFDVLEVIQKVFANSEAHDLLKLCLNEKQRDTAIFTGREVLGDLLKVSTDAQTLSYTKDILTKGLFDPYEILCDLEKLALLARHEGVKQEIERLRSEKKIYRGSYSDLSASELIEVFNTPAAKAIYDTISKSDVGNGSEHTAFLHPEEILALSKNEKATQIITELLPDHNWYDNVTIAISLANNDKAYNLAKDIGLKTVLEGVISEDFVNLANTISDQAKTYILQLIKGADKPKDVLLDIIKYPQNYSLENPPAKPDAFAGRTPSDIILAGYAEKLENNPTLGAA